MHAQVIDLSLHGDGVLSQKPPFFPTLVRSFYDFDSYNDVLPGGARGGFAYLFKLALVLGVVAIIMSSVYYYRLMTAVIQPAFKDSPALAWKNGELNATGSVPFKAVIPELDLALAVDTRETPDRSLLEAAPETHLFASNRVMVQVRGELKLDTPYGTLFDGRAYPAGKMYLINWPDPTMLPSGNPLVLYVVASLVALFLAAAASIIVAGLGIGILPQARHLGGGAAWSVAAHSMAPAMVVFSAGVMVLSWLHPAKPGSVALWVPWLLSITVGTVVTFLAFKACIAEKPRSPRKRRESDRSLDRDLLPPDRV